MTTSSLILSTDQQAQVDLLAQTLDRDQAIWLSGYFAGFAAHGTGAAATSPTAMAVSNGNGAGVAVPTTATPTATPATRLLTILYGTDTGNSKELATELATAAKAQGRESKVADMADYKPRGLKDEQDLLVVTATHGEGDPPPAAVGFFEFLAGRKAPKLAGVRFAVLALGDSTYEHYCSAGKQVDARLEELGAERIADRVDCDVDYEDDAASWIADVVAKLAPTESAPVASAPVINGVADGAGAPAAYGKKHPFQASVLENVVLTGRGSTKETRHVELSIADSGLTYQPGDALGVVPQNDPELVATLLDRLSLSAGVTVTTKKGPLPLDEALTRTFEITAGTPRFLEHWGKLAGSTELTELAAGDAKTRTAYLYEHHVLDIVERFPVPGIDAEQLIAGLRPLQPRLYSIASSLEAAPDEAHLTVSTVQYDLHDIARTGVASGHLARLTGDDDTVPVYVQANEHFRLPADDDTPIIMVGAGTGVAPYRAFMQEREARGVAGRSWLFFGERNFRSDFLYQVEWQQLLKDGVLTKLDLAFSRDAAPKTYVQDRLRRQGRDVYAWLEEGARIYVCGDATNMAPDVDTALAEIVGEHGGRDREAAEEYLTTLKSDHRYLLDVY